MYHQATSLLRTTDTIDEICDIIGADSLGYLKVERLGEMIRRTCLTVTGCFTGKYPLEPPKEGYSW